VGRNPHVNRHQWMHDMTAVWNLARMWYFTGDEAYARKSRDILIAWAGTQKSFEGMEANLDLGDHAFRFAGGADLLRGTWRGWTEADTAAVKKLFANVYWPSTGAGGDSTLGPGNKGGLSLSAATAIAVFNDDQTKLDKVLYLLRTAPSTGFANTLPNGEHGESGRDQGHSYGQMLAMSFISEVLWKQGIDVFSERDNRVLAMGEYYARLNLNVDTPFVPMGTTDEYYHGIWDKPGFAAEPMAFSIMKGAYVLRKGMSAPYLEQKLALQGVNADSFMFLKSADSSKAARPPAIIFPGAGLVGSGELTSADIGDAKPAGGGSYDDGVWTVKGGLQHLDPWRGGLPLRLQAGDRRLRHHRQGELRAKHAPDGQGGRHDPFRSQGGSRVEGVGGHHARQDRGNLHGRLDGGLRGFQLGGTVVRGAADSLLGEDPAVG
jgi:hypothetical protein